MARARNIKPAFFNDDELSELTPITRLYFIGLWTICDFRGNLEYRPKRIKALVLPYDDASIEELTINLERARFIRLYSVQGKPYINIVNFTKHQNPHKNERAAGSDIPEYVESAQQVLDLEEESEKPDKIGTNTDNIGTARADSLLLIPDSLNPLTDSLEESAENPESIEVPPEPKPKTTAHGKFNMGYFWEPEPQTWEANLFRSGCSGYNPAELAEFIMYWSGEQVVFTESQWQGKLIGSLKRQKAKAPPIDEQQKMSEATSGSTRSNWAEGMRNG